jgi:hypothetical protein
MSNRAELNSILNLYQHSSTAIKTPAYYAAQNPDQIFNIPSEEYTRLVSAARTLSKDETTAENNLKHLVQGAILAAPYGITTFLDTVDQAIQNQPHLVSQVINTWLNDQYKQNNTALYDSSKNIEFASKNDKYCIKTSRNGEEIQSFVKKTNACIAKESPYFFNQIAQDPGTVVLLGVNNKHAETYKNQPQGSPEIGYLMLTLYQDQTKHERALTADNIWVNHQSKGLENSLLQAIIPVACFLHINLLDKALDTPQLDKNKHLLESYFQETDLFKLGSVPQMMRYAKIRIPKENSSYRLRIKDKPQNKSYN